MHRNQGAALGILLAVACTRPNWGATTGTAGGASEGAGGGTTTGGGTTSAGTTSAGTTSGGSGGVCPSVLIVLDLSGSMDAPPSGSGNRTKLDIAKSALESLVTTRADHFAFGLETFSNSRDDCSDGVHTLDEPAVGDGATISSDLALLVTNVSTNTEAALAVANTNSALLDARRPRHAILLVTDGVPACADDGTDVAQTITQVQTAASHAILTFVIALGVLAPGDPAAIEQFAQASPSSACSGAGCDGNSYYPAVDATALDGILAAIASRLDTGACSQ